MSVLTYLAQLADLAFRPMTPIVQCSVTHFGVVLLNILFLSLVILRDLEGPGADLEVSRINWTVHEQQWFVQRWQGITFQSYSKRFVTLYSF